jgi:hypothetical protein
VSRSTSLSGGPPGPIPAASVAAMYFRAILRPTFRLAAVSLLLRPVCR